jgi:hypothetical protein
MRRPLVTILRAVTGDELIEITPLKGIHFSVKCLFVRRS